MTTPPAAIDAAAEWLYDEHEYVERMFAHLDDLGFIVVAKDRPRERHAGTITIAVDLDVTPAITALGELAEAFRNIDPEETR